MNEQKIVPSLQLNFPYGAQPDIIRANQKDIYYQSILQEQLTRIVQQFLGARVQHLWQKEIDTLSSLCYYSLTTLLGTQTLGEEYCDLVQLSQSAQTYPSLIRRFCLVFVNCLLPYLYTKSVVEFKKSARQDQKKEKWVGWLTRIQQILKHIKPIHLAIFYFFGAYYNLSKRLTGIRYIFTRQLGPHEQRAGYEVLGGLIMIQLSIQAFLALRKRIPNTLKKEGKESEKEEEEKEKEEDEEEKVVAEDDYDFMDSIDRVDEEVEEKELGYEELQRLKCALCLETRTITTSTPCGHLFCWNCIIEWCENKSECPLCRSHVNISHVIPLNNF